MAQRRKPQVLYRSEIDGRKLELVQLGAVYELILTLTNSMRIAISLVDPSFASPLIEAKRQ